ncbi:hypothetical protein MABM_30040 [Mycobacteroides abscessus]|nr:hypothetical protein MABM_30040 [Mycobacteroides abscessus]
MGSLRVLFGATYDPRLANPTPRPESGASPDAPSRTETRLPALLCWRGQMRVSGAGRVGRELVELGIWLWGLDKCWWGGVFVEGWRLTDGLNA